MRQVWCLLLVLLHVGVLAVQAPHLVHHAFEGHVGSSDDCAFAAAADHGPASAASVVALEAPADLVGGLLAAPLPRLAGFHACPRSSRAPPRPSA